MKNRRLKGFVLVEDGFVPIKVGIVHQIRVQQHIKLSELCTISGESMKTVLEIDEGKAYVDTSVAINISAALCIPLELIVSDCPSQAKKLRDEELLRFVEISRRNPVKKNICPVCESEYTVDELWDEDEEYGIRVKYCHHCGWGQSVELKTGKEIMC
jgi:uncharacterized Fe-S center protein